MRKAFPTALSNLRARVRTALQPPLGFERRVLAEKIAVERKKRPNLPFCTSHEGDLLFRIASLTAVGQALEVDFATGSTAFYLVQAVTARGGKVVSIDYRQSDFNNLGVETIQNSPYATAHFLFEGNTNEVLPRVLAEVQNFDLAFLDGRKVFDHLMLDVYYTVRLLRKGGYIVFDDSRTAAVRKVISFLVKYYKCQEIDCRAFGETWKHRVWCFFPQGLRDWRRPYRAFESRTRSRIYPPYLNVSFYVPF